MSSLEFINKSEPEIRKPLVIAAMQDMGNVGSIVVNFINKSLSTVPFRHVKSTRPPYVYDRGGFIEIPEEKWEYRFGNDFIIFGGGPGQPQQNDELNELCQDVIDIAKKYDAKFISCKKMIFLPSSFPFFKLGFQIIDQVLVINFSLINIRLIWYFYTNRFGIQTFFSFFLFSVFIILNSSRTVFPSRISFESNSPKSFPLDFVTCFIALAKSFGGYRYTRTF